MFYWALKYTIGSTVKLIFRPEVAGRENLPENGAALLVGNHPSFSDSVFLSAVMRRKVVYIAKLEYFTGTGLKGRLRRMVIGGMGNIPVDRAGGRKAASTLGTAQEVLEQGGLVCMYPEGTRPPDNRLYRGKTGAARIALATGVPVIPIAMLNTYEIQPPGKLIPKVMRARMAVGTPIDLTPFRDLPSGVASRALTDEIMRRLQALSGQDYVHMYAQAARQKFESGDRPPTCPEGPPDTGSGVVTPTGDAAVS
ncbi:lysophospholipid acyltransferase family protein [Micromonospora parathelypteridis]|uniref:1-acyl-sn-glycerol-3-phosphate acyltransferase n=1 Tax=Micromonospora parathelypteridis TaxID=1839617 RepID=A0A840W4M5_9ACTN|nr:lysophospholipid acyltransferase family protein [Micromonospora parathelypteridis]MBB5480984.1 1-acyl-sn-glycerol-3-phosphate acyltransferase [Micromonospora parathelypteridis]GGO20641.1 1-acyl-sn-glycerol-3-phosphate acyltransferase [Micromonospora parathelypteridis]